MERWKGLNRYQKGVLVFIAVLVLVFTVLYPLTIARVGYLYRDAILFPSQQGDRVVYSGRVQGRQASFTVFPDQSVEYQWGDETYGPYTCRKDPTAVPKNGEMGEYMTGIELLCGEDVIFRGGVLNQGGDFWLYREDGGLEYVDIWVNDGVTMEVNGEPVDSAAPSPSVVLEVMSGPELSHKGEWSAWVEGVFLCILTAVTVLFADELFRWRLAFSVRNAEQAEPSEWEMMGRYLSWTLLPILAAVVFVVGLQS